MEKTTHFFMNFLYLVFSFGTFLWRLTHHWCLLGLNCNIVYHCLAFHFCKGTLGFWSGLVSILSLKSHHVFFKTGAYQGPKVAARDACFFHVLVNICIGCLLQKKDMQKLSITTNFWSFLFCQSFGRLFKTSKVKTYCWMG